MEWELQFFLLFFSVETFSFLCEASEHCHHQIEREREFEENFMIRANNSFLV